MKNIIKLFVVAMLMAVMPIRSFAQPTRIADHEATISFNITQVVNFDERVFFLYSLMTDGRFEVITSEQDGVFVVSASEAFEGLNLAEAFADFRGQNADDFARMSKEQAAMIASECKGLLPFEFTNSLMMDYYIRSRQNNTCANADPFCTDNGLYEFPAGVNAGSGESGPYYSCLYSTPNPAWYYMRILNPGNIDIYMYSTPSHDIDFCCWGPFDDPSTPCPYGLTSDKVVSCSYSTASSEHCMIPSSAQTGEYYILIITNFSNAQCNISFSKVAGTGTTDCGILPPLVNNSGPYCVGETIMLTATGQSGASYSWSGPGGFNSNQQNPTRPNCTMAMAGTYTCTIALGSQTNSATTEVVVYPMPTANFNFTTVCLGNPTQFTSTSTTNPSGQQIQSYQWNFGDGQTGSGQNVSHTYAQAGTYQVTLTVSTGGHCTSTKTQTVTVNAQPTANFTYTTVCQGTATQFTSTSTGQGITSYNWNFGDGQTGSGQNVSHTYAQAGTYQVTLTVATSGGSCSDDITQPVTVNSQPTSNFTYTSVCRGNPTQFTSTSTGQGITSYQWNFGDGQTGTGQNVTHTYAQAGDYQVTLTVSTNGHCTDQKTQTVPVYASPIASATAQPSTVIYGSTSTLTASAGATGSFNFHWEPANMVVNPNNQTTQTVPLQATQTFTVTVTNPQGGCNSSAQVTVSIDGSGMTAMATADQTSLCLGESTTLHALPSGGAGNYTYSWTPANTLNNPNIQNPVATPPLGSTTYTCHVGDGFTNIDISVTIVVHPHVEYDTYQTICENDTYNFFGQDLHTPGVYDHTLQTQYGCDSIIHLHLENWDTYETSISDDFCENEVYMFFDQPIMEAGVYYHTLESVHGCDSVIRISLTTNPVYEFELFESTCEGGPGYYFNGDYLHPSPDPYYYEFETAQGCDSIIFLHIDEAEYNSKSYNVSICATEYTWASNGLTYYESGTFYDTIHYENSCDSTLILNLTLRHSTDTLVPVTICDQYHWVWANFDEWFTQSHYQTYDYINEDGCPSQVTLDLTIMDHDSIVQSQLDSNPLHIQYNGVTGCDSVYWNFNGHDYVSLDGYYTDPYEWITQSSPQGSPGYQRKYQNHDGCDSLVFFPLRLEYTPDPVEIGPVDHNDPAPHWVITATEFQINSYEYYIHENTHPTCHWDSITWHFQKKLNSGEWVEAPSIQWILEPDTTTQPTPRMKCRMYVLNYIQDTVWLAATVHNKCADPVGGITRRYWFVCSFYGVEENTIPVSFDVIPNPNNGQMKLNFEHLSGKVNVRVYDMRGTLIDQFETYNGDGPSTYDYNMKAKSDGIYFFVATGKEGTVAKKVVIEK